jgi:hypothetical protein
MGKPGPESKLIKKMREAAAEIYGDRLVIVKYHGSQFGEAGVSDLLCCLDGWFIAVEVKAPESYNNNVERALEEGPTLKQKAFTKRVLAADGVAGYAATVDQFLDILATVEE